MGHTFADWLFANNTIILVWLLLATILQVSKKGD